MQRSLKDIDDSTKRVVEGAKLLAEAFAVREVADGIKGALDFAAAMKVQADRIGITAETGLNTR